MIKKVAKNIPTSGKYEVDVKGGVKEIKVPMGGTDGYTFVTLDGDGKPSTKTVELKVIDGAAEMLGGSRPIILSEISDLMLSAHGSCSGELIGELRKSKYEVFSAISWRKVSGEGVEGDILAVPEEKVDSFRR